MLKEKITRIEKQMQAQLEDIRETHKHSGVKGDSVEDIVREFLRKYLPRRMDVGHGEIIDSSERISGQTDVVITTQEHPFTYTPDKAGLFFVEGVAAVGEVKTTLNSSHLDSALSNAKKFKRLKPHTLGGLIGYKYGSNHEQVYNYVPPFFIFAFESSLSFEKISQTINEFQKINSLEYYQLPDCVLILNRGLLINLSGSGDSSSIVLYDDENNVLDKPPWLLEKSNTCLFEFMVWLTMVIRHEIRFKSVLSGYLWKGRTI
ncbi:MAG: DUF6602 domain-containing protein [Aggregatilineales bacterium]